MPTLEMALVVENIYHGIRRCFGPENDYPIKRHRPSKMYRQCRYKQLRSKMHQCGSFRVGGGADWCANQRRFRGYHSETNSKCSTSERSLSEFEASTDYILQQQQSEQEPCARTLCSMQPVDSRYQLHYSVSGLAAALDHGHCQRKIWKLQRRSLMENAWEVIGIQCACWWSRYSPNLGALCIESSLDFLSRQLTPEQRQANEPEPDIVHYIREFVNLCRKIYQAADSVISDALCFKSSPTLDVLNINELIPDLNSALIQYLLRLEELPEINSF
ncbi:uncharacterized protein LOC111070160 [Drosophila obscura]|uniref:uncharacterized protein LOC111070160 n=1 Tax=Drosophila obscura TaxID=7282 RepID=UPI000BA1638A|nr:uncharacterized protein LOC111070160 [Drosophila obscura]